MITLKKGTHYTKEELGIQYPASLKSHIEHEGRQYLFAVINNGKYHNELHPDGLVHEPGDAEDLVNYTAKCDDTRNGRHIMVRFLPTGAYEYLGEEDYMIRYDPKRNKIVLKQDKEPANG